MSTSVVGSSVTRSVGGRVRWLVFGVGLLMVAAGVQAPFAAAPAVAAEGLACADVAGSQVDAVALAKACDRVVEVSSATSEISRTVAHPSGMFEWEQHVVPVRVRRGEGWTPVDTSLRVLADGRLAAVASTVDARFSAGGAGPLVTITAAGGKTASMSWPHSLPSPRVEGDSAVYAEVLAGVDLRVRATAVGFSHVLVVKNAVAAANPALRTIAFVWSSGGLTVSAGSDGTVQVVDGTDVVVASQPASMWDSGPASDPAASRSGGFIAGDGEQLSTQDVSSPSSPGDLAQVAPVAVRLDGDRMVLSPDEGLLSGAGTVFPLFIDPVFGSPRQKWAYASQKGEGRTDGIARVGNAPDGDGLWRSFFQFGLGSAVAYKTVYDARFYTVLDHSSACSATPVSLYLTSAIPGGVGNGGRTAWSPSLATHLDEQWGSANEQSCPKPDDAMEFTGDLKAKVQEWVNNNWSNATLGLSTRREDGSGESVTGYWKKFFPEQTRLTIWYNSLPNTPTVNAHPSSDCFKVCTSSTTVSTSGAQTQGWWKLNETSGSTADDASSSDRDGTASGGVSWSSGAAVFNGSTQAFATASSPLNMHRSFSVSVWAKRSSGGSGDFCKIALSQRATRSVGFWLGTCGERWELGRAESDTDNAVPRFVQAPSPVTLNVWVHLVGVYNDVYNTLTFYINNGLVGSVVLAGAYAADGGLLIGRSWYNGGAYGWFPGSIDNVQVYQRAISTADVSDLYDAGRGGGALSISSAVVRDSTPALRVGVSDPDSGAKLRTEFEIRTAPTGTASLVATSGNLAEVAAPATVTWTVPSGELSNGGTYYWRARSHDEVGWTGDWTPFQAMRIDTSAPATPTVSSSQYPYKAWGVQVGSQGTFTLSDSSTDTYEFEWWVDGGSHAVKTASGSSPRTGSVTWTPPTDMVHTLYVKAKDSAGNVSSTHSHQFWVAPTPNKFAHWSLDENSGATVADSGNAPTEDGSLSPATLSGAVTFGPGHVRDVNQQVTNGLVFTGDATAATSGPVLDTTKAFTVMAWVSPSDLTADRTIVSQDGNGSSRLQLHFDRQANNGNGGWCFSMRASDGAVPVSACANGADLGFPVAGTWIHVAAVYNPGLSSEQIRIYVMGDPLTCFDPVGETAASNFTGAWSATGQFVIGRAKADSSPGEFWRGSIDDAWAHQKALSGVEICQKAQP